MNYKSVKYLFFKSNISLIINSMIPGDHYMPCFTKAVKIESIIKKFYKKKILSRLKTKKIDSNKKVNFDIYINILENDVLEAYFTSKLVIKALNLRKKDYLKNVKKENITSLLKKVNLQKKYFKK